MLVKKKNLSTIFIVCALSALFLIFASGCGASAASAGKYIAGTYTGEGRGMGAIEVIITVDDNAITDVQVVGDGETEGIGGREGIDDGTYATQIIDAQSIEIDGVSGATLTNNGVVTALEDALGQALR